MSLRNEDYTDRELLALIRRLASPASSDEIATELGMKVRDVVTRLAWMRRYGFLDQIMDGRRSVGWLLTDAGDELVNGRLGAQASRALEGMGAGTRLLAMRQLMERGYVDERDVYANALRREYLHQAARRTRR
jgi:hypothetical protein